MVRYGLRGDEVTGDVMRVVRNIRRKMGGLMRQEQNLEGRKEIRKSKLKFSKK
jgi:hypothetical protein